MDESERAEAMMMSTCISKSAVRGAELIISTTFTQHFTHNLSCSQFHQSTLIFAYNGHPGLVSDMFKLCHLRGRQTYESLDLGGVARTSFPALAFQQRVRT